MNGDTKEILMAISTNQAVSKEQHKESLRRFDRVDNKLGEHDTRLGAVEQANAIDEEKLESVEKIAHLQIKEVDKKVTSKLKMLTIIGVILSVLMGANAFLNAYFNISNGTGGP